MGPCGISRKVTPNASVHVVHVRRRSANIQHGDRVHAASQPVEERSWDEPRCVANCYGVARSVLDSTHRIAFAPFASSSSPSEAKSWTTLPLQKAVYILCNILTLGVGLWKCRSMGLLPTGTGDWLAFETRGTVSVQVSLPYRATDNVCITRRQRYLCFRVCIGHVLALWHSFPRSFHPATRAHKPSSSNSESNWSLGSGTSLLTIARNRAIPMLVSSLQRYDANADTNTMR